MGTTIILLLCGLGVGLLINFFLDHKPSKFLLKFALAGIVVGLLGSIIGGMTSGEACLALLIVICTGIIIEEFRKKGTPTDTEA